MMNRLYPAAALLCACTALAQEAKLEALLEAKPDPVPDGAPSSMGQIDRADLARHAFHFASDELGGRHTGTPGQAAAALYIANHFAKLGLEPFGDKPVSDETAEDSQAGKRAFTQSYSVRRKSLDPAGTGIRLGQTPYDDGFGVVIGRGADSVDVSGKLVYVGLGRSRELPKAFGEGEIPVAILPPARPTKRKLPSEMALMAGFSLLRSRVGPPANRVASRDAKLLVLLDLGNRLAEILSYGGVLPGKPDLAYGNEMGIGAMIGGMGGEVPTVVVSAELAKQFMAQLKLEMNEDGKVTQTGPSEAEGRVAVALKREAEFPCTNVVAVLRGSDPVLRDEAIVFSAHMDHMGTRVDGQVFNGADDNASGSSALLEVAEAFAKGVKPKRSVIFLSVSGEELGLWGSAHFAANSPWPIDKLVANVNIDMIGRATKLSDEDEISATPSHRHSQFSSLVRDAARLAQSFDLDLTNGDTFYERSDHYNFAKRGVPVVFFCDGEHEDYHKVTDTPDKLDYEKMERVARLAFWTGWRAADAEGRPERIGRQRDWLENSAK